MEKHLVETHIIIVLTFPSDKHVNVKITLNNTAFYTMFEQLLRNNITKTQTSTKSDKAGVSDQQSRKQCVQF